MDVLRRNNVKVTGRGEMAMIFAHGYGCDQNMWRHVAPAFEDSHRVVLYDLVGSGRSDASAYDRDKYGTLHGHAVDVLEICNAVGAEDAIFVGHSVSATIGILAAQKQACFSKLVLVSPSPCFINDGDYIGGFQREDIEELLEFLDSNYLGWSRTMAPVIMGNPDRPELGEELVNSFCQADPEISKHFARVTFTADHRADLPGLGMPALILQCSNDAIAPVCVGEYMERTLAQGRLIVMNATGHCPHLSAPAETIAAIKSFI